MTRIFAPIIVTLMTASVFLLAVTLVANAHPEHTHHCHIDHSRCH